MACDASSIEGAQDVVEWHCFDYDITFEDYSVLRALEPGHCVVSENFIAGKYHWELHYFPNGVEENNEGYSSVFVKLPDSVTGCNPLIKTRFHIVMHHNFYGYDHLENDIVSSLDPSVHTFCAENPIWGFDRFISKSIVEEKCWDRSNDLIKLRCYIWVTREFSNGVKRRVRKREEDEY
ncbi:BTB/POZ and MATH domain-containing protein 3-like isoform X1 [Carex littledalei]|uniref:BTB/POZ and MATH domain-containing protein 3-like isoform X1 n=1 Tax=Carex littledalei TaxID=544730 RepID=A0A833R6F1_9POAL|nr:BTB/POZ and MATH domain-containing protein 3-like isoform X1 [Carex littledalei]